MSKQARQSARGKLDQMRYELRRRLNGQGVSLFPTLTIQQIQNAIYRLSQNIEAVDLRNKRPQPLPRDRSQTRRAIETETDVLGLLLE